MEPRMKFCLSVTNVCIFTLAVTCLPESGVMADISGLASQFLTFLNRLRQRQSLHPLVWNEYLAWESQAGAEGCTSLWSMHQHWSRHMTTYMGVSNRTGYPANAVQSWLREKAFIRNGDASACCNEDDNYCCRYALIMNSSMNSVGCGAAFCPRQNRVMKEFADLYIYVCEFGSYDLQ